MNLPYPFVLKDLEDGFLLVFTDPESGLTEDVFPVRGLSPENKEKSRNLVNQMHQLCNEAYQRGVTYGTVSSLLASSPLSPTVH